MPVTMGCMLYVDGKLTAAGYSLEQTRRRAAAYIHGRRALRIEYRVASMATEAWAYDYGIEAWVLQRSLVANDGDYDHSSSWNP